MAHCVDSGLLKSQAGVGHRQTRAQIFRCTSAQWRHQLVVVLFVTLMASSVAQSFARPFIRRRDNLLDIATMLVLTITFEVGVLGVVVAQSNVASLVDFILVLNVAMLVILAACCLWDYRWVVYEGHRRLSRRSTSRMKSSSDSLEMYDMPDLVELHIENR